MSDFLGELRAHFREGTTERLREMHLLLDAAELGEADAFARLERHFHALAGMGATYGFPRISELGDEGERTRDCARWRELVDAVARALC